METISTHIEKKDVARKGKIDPHSRFCNLMGKDFLTKINGNYKITSLTLEDEEAATNLIRKNLDQFDEAGSVLASTFRRIKNLYRSYSKDGHKFLILRSKKQGSIIGCAGLGPLAGLSKDEKIAEISELVIDSSYRGTGLGAFLLKASLETAFEMGYQRIYLETTPGMQKARKLFDSFGFIPITEKSEYDDLGNSQKSISDTIPCYYLLSYQ